jgi:hypothetical protein
MRGVAARVEKRSRGRCHNANEHAGGIVKNRQAPAVTSRSAWVKLSHDGAEVGCLLNLTFRSVALSTTVNRKSSVAATQLLTAQLPLCFDAPA